MTYLVALTFLFTFLFFIRKGKSYGYQAIAERTKLLNQNGVKRVYLASSLSSVGRDRGYSIWQSLNVGYLLYIQGQQLIVESPWWRQMSQLAVIDIDAQTSLELVDNAATVWRKRPGLKVNGVEYALRDINQAEQKKIKLALRRASPQLTEGFRSDLIDEFELVKDSTSVFSRNGLIIGPS